MTDQVTASDLTAWLSARYDEQEQQARAATPGPWLVGKSGEVETVAKYGTPGYEEPLRVTQDGEGLSAAIDEPDAAYIAAHDPAWALADLAVKRAILADHVMDDFGAFEPDDLDPPPICLRCKSVEAYYEAAKWPCRTVRLLASEFAGEPGYDQEGWAP